MRTSYPILLLCLNLEVSARGYCDWLNQGSTTGRGRLKDHALAAEIESIHVYFVAILDHNSRRIDDWPTSLSIDAALVRKGLAIDLLHRTPPVNLLPHSDRGVQYEVLGNGGPRNGATTTQSMLGTAATPTIGLPPKDPAAPAAKFRVADGRTPGVVPPSVERAKSLKHVIPD